MKHCDRYRALCWTHGKGDDLLRGAVVGDSDSEEEGGRKGRKGKGDLLGAGVRAALTFGCALLTSCALAVVAPAPGLARVLSFCTLLWCVCFFVVVLRFRFTGCGLAVFE
jgi:hypothetical protein